MSKLAKLFLKVAQPDDEGKTRVWYFDELESLYPGEKFKTDNGGGWRRASDPDLMPFEVKTIKDNTGVIGIQLDGFKDDSISKSIRADILKSIRKQRCRVVDVNSDLIECDHKDGRYTSETYSDINNQKEDDFQPLHKNVNSSKRQHCKVCRETNERYDANRLGYSVGWYLGKSNYEGTCVGCYWYDPRKFNQVVSKDFKP